MQLLTRVTHKGNDYYGASDSAGSTFFGAIDLKLFNQGLYEYSESDYIKLSNDQEGWKLNRFVNNHLLYVDNVWREDTDEDFTKIKVFSTEALAVTQNFEIPFSVEQLQKVGNNVLLVGYDNEDYLILSSLSLDDDRGIVDKNMLKNIEISEFRSHGFFYKPNSEGGVFAIPLDIEVTEGKTWKKENGVYYDLESTTNMFYTQLNTDLTMQNLGQLEGSKEIIWSSNADCNISCTDWYGSSRPIFWGDRVFSLIKYELIEGILEDGKISEFSRFNFK